MKTGDLTRLFGVSDTTIRKWTHEFEVFLSDSAKAVNIRQRIYNDSDVLLLATVAKLSGEGYPYHLIKERLAAGERVEHPGVANFGVDTRLVPAAAVEQIIDSTELKIELEQIRLERDRLIVELERERDKNEELQDKLDSLQDRLQELLLRVGIAEGRLSEIDRNRRSADND